MKKLFAYLFLVICLLFPNCNVTTATPNYTIQYLENGDYIITEIYTSDATSRTATSKSKKASYYSQDHIFIFSITISATFDYTYGVRASATSANAIVNIADSSAVFKSKNSYVSGNTAYGTATVLYQGSNKTLNINMSCDIYGNIS